MIISEYGYTFTKSLFLARVEDSGISWFILYAIANQEEEQHVAYGHDASMTSFYVDNVTTIHDEKYEISDQDIKQQPHKTPNHTTIDSYIHLVGNDTIQRFGRIQQYNKAFEDCLNHQSALQSWNIKQRQEAPDIPSSVTPRDNNKQQQHHTLKRLFHKPSSLFITPKIHSIDIKKRLNRKSFLFHHHHNNDVLTDNVLLV
ncbi:hypothetical protein K501DRAFT_337472 [Backusella circina FSU 941]|nr:hypothetical protein K501DRAFT_337472 [Backusella circina FSU 941]